MTEPRQSLKPDKRTGILNAAEEIFNEKGFSHTSMSEIAKRSKVAKGTLYLYFTSKNELCIAVVNNYLEKCYQVLETVEQSSILNIARQFQNTAEANPLLKVALLNYKSHKTECICDSDYLQKNKQKNEDIQNKLFGLLSTEYNLTELTTEQKKILLSLLWGDSSGLLASQLFIDSEEEKSAYYSLFIMIDQCLKSNNLPLFLKPFKEQ